MNSRKQNELLQAMIDASPDLMVLKDTAGRWLKANKQTLLVFDIPENGYKGKTEKELGALYPHFSPHISTFLASDEQAWQEGQPIKVNEMIFTSGEMRVFEVLKTPVYDQNRQPEALVVAGRDITEQLKSEKRHSAFLADHPNALYSLDANGRFLDVNAEAELLSGYTKSELTGQHFAPLIHEQSLPRMLQAFEKVKQGHTISEHIQMVQRNGAIREVFLKTIPTVLQGQIIGIQGLAQDMTEVKKAVRRARELQKMLEDAVRQQQGLIFSYAKENNEFIHTLCDGEFLRKMGLTPAQVVGRSLTEFFSEKEAAFMQPFYEQAWAGEEVSFDGKLGPFKCLIALRPVFEHGTVVKVIGSVIDITERIAAEKARRESEEKYRIIAENSTDMIRVMNRDFTFAYVSPANSRVLGYRPEEMIGRSVFDFVCEDDKKIAAPILESILVSKKSVTSTIRYRSSHGAKKWVESTLSPVEEKGEVTSIVTVSRDITDRKELEEQMRHMAYHDELTGLANRRFFNETLQQELKTAERLAVLYFDMDRFKVINDTLGHSAGDTLLAVAADRLKKHFQREEMLARMGGDEFAMLIRNPADGAAEQAAKQLLHIMRAPFEAAGRSMQMTASVGISFFPEHSKDAAELLKQADTAMYLAKEQGKNKYCFYSAGHTHAKQHKLYLESDLQQAVLRNELFLMYQPKVCFTSGDVTGCEALLRWQHPQWGLIPPDEFIPIAEESGQIVPIGEWVIGEALRQMNEWQQSGGKPVRMAINLSLKQMLSPAFVPAVETALQKFRISPERVEFEITESVMMADLEAALCLVKTLKQTGITIAIDDFGTGYSSLSHLKRFPVDTLKIDRSFIRGLPDDQEDQAITSLILSMSKHLQLETVAEGIETKQQFELLQRMGCQEYQGYFFSKPLAGTEMGQLLSEQATAGKPGASFFKMNGNHDIV